MLDATFCSRQSQQLRLGAVDIDIDLRIVVGLLDVQIDGARNRIQLLQKLVRQLLIAFDVGPDDLHVERRGQAEIQDLADDVRRQELKTGRRKGRGELVAQHRADSRSSEECFFARLMKMSASPGPTGAEVL